MSIRRHPAALLLVALVACSSAEDGPTDAPAASRNVDGIRYSAETLVMESYPVQLATIVTATNTGGTAATLTFPDGCIVFLRAYADESRDGRPAYDQARDRACTMMIEERVVPGGGSIELRTSSDARAILGDSLPNGRYWLSAVLRPNGATLELPAGVADLAVGDAE